MSVNKKDSASEIDEALNVLADALVGQENSNVEPSSLALARKILVSSLGNHQGNIDIVWHKMERTVPPKEYAEIRRLHEELTTVDSKQLADGVVSVLSKFAGDDELADSRLYHSKTTRRAGPKSNPTQMDVSNLDLSSLSLKIQSEEELLLSECKLALQGVDGERIRFSQGGVCIHPASRIILNETCHPIIPSKMGTGAINGIRQCGEAGWLYIRIQDFIHNVCACSPHKGSVAQAFAGVLAREMRDYHAFLACAQVSNCNTLRQLLVTMHQPTGRLKTLAMLADGLKDLSGAYLLSALYKHSIHGDTRHRTLVESLLDQSSRPFFTMLYQFATSGILVDPYKEFFVALSGIDDNAVHWHDRYEFQMEKIPRGILEEQTALICLKLGRSINFIRTTLQDTKWTLDLGIDKACDGEDLQKVLGFCYSPESIASQAGRSRLHRTLEAFAGQVHSHSIQSLLEDHHLMEHLWALKQFLLLGQGDFFSALMEGLQSEFDGRSGLAGIYKHSLMSHVESALLSTNARGLPPYVLDRLAVDLSWEANHDGRYQFAQPRDIPAGSKNEDRSGWDIFVLTYDVPGPLEAIVHPASMKKYQTIFSLLFRLKRIESMLNSTWRQSIALTHALHTFAQHNGIGVNNAGYSTALVFLREVSITRQSMMHFCKNLKSYFMFEVLEAGWKDLVTRIESARTIDDIITAHDNYLEDIFRKSLLADLINTDALPAKIEYLLTLCASFARLQDSYFTDALDASERARERRREAEKRAELGQWGFDSEREVHEEETFFGLTDKTKIASVHHISEEFSEKMIELLGQLDQVVNGPKAVAGPETESLMSPAISMMSDVGPLCKQNQLDHDSLRFLARQLDYSDYFYSTAFL